MNGAHALMIAALSIVLTLPLFAADYTLGTYRYDPSGNIESIGPDSNGKTQTFRYDSAGRLILAEERDSANAVTWSDSYEYDAYGNRTKVTTNGVATTAPVAGTSNRLDGAGITYDIAGNVTALNGTIYAYDPVGTMTSKTGEQGTAYYLYDANDERIAIEGVDHTWRYTVRDVDGKVLREWASDTETSQVGWIEDYVYAGSRLTAAVRSTAQGGARHFHLDHLGSPRMITGLGGQPYSLHDYAPFGPERTDPLQEVTLGFDTPEPKQFTGHERDYAEGYDEPPLDYMHARYYAPDRGRFLSVDPTWDSADARRPQTWNRYTYAKNVPVVYVDPDGAAPGNVTFKLGRWSFHLDYTHSSRGGAPHFDVKRGPKKLGRFQIDKWAAEAGDEIPNSAIKLLEEGAEGGRLPGAAMRALLKHAPEAIKVAGRLTVVIGIVLEIALADDANANEDVALEQVNEQTQRLFGKNMEDLSAAELVQYWRIMRAEAELAPPKKRILD